MSVAEYSEANLRLRRERAAVLRRLVLSSMANGPAFCAQLLEAPPSCIEGMDVHDLLEKCPGIGVARADRMQAAAGLFRAVSVRELPYGRRSALCALLRFGPSAGGESR